MEILDFSAEKELRETALADADDSGLITPGVCSAQKNLRIPARRIGIVSARQRIADARGIV